MKARSLLNEAVSTFGLVFLGTGACVVDSVYAGALGVVGVGLAWGASVWIMAALSGADMNPAVTLAMTLTGRLPAGDAAPRAAAQACGAAAASAVLRALFGADSGLGATAPAAGLMPSFILEFAMTFALISAVLRLPGRFVPTAAGAIVALEAVFAGPLTGASMNPVRSMAPALFSGRSEGLWLYLVAPMLGGWAAAAFASPTPAPRRGT